MNHNPNECDIVQDLLPLYYDHACSPASCELVRQHLADCADCEKIYEDLANHTIDNVIETESREILERHAKKERNLAYKAGIVIAALLLVPILITFIVSMAGGSGLGVFSVVTASMMLVAAYDYSPHAQKPDCSHPVLSALSPFTCIRLCLPHPTGYS